MTSWPVLFFGAPGAILGLVVCVLGVLGEKRSLLFLGGLILVPSSLYLGGHLWPLLGLPLFPWMAALWVRRVSFARALLFLVPNAAAAVFMAAVTISNLSSHFVRFG